MSRRRLILPREQILDPFGNGMSAAFLTPTTTFPAFASLALSSRAGNLATYQILPEFLLRRNFKEKVLHCRAVQPALQLLPRFYSKALPAQSRYSLDLKRTMPRKGSTKANAQAEASTSAPSVPHNDAQQSLSTQKSSFSSSVTLFTLDSANEDGAGLRRSPRKRVKMEADEVQLGQASDIEDAVQPIGSAARISPLVALRNTLAGGGTASASTGEGKGENATVKSEESLELGSPLSSAPSSPSSSSERNTRSKGKGKVKAVSESISSVLKTEDLKVEDELSSLTPRASSMKTKGKAKAQKPVPIALATPHPAPEHWEEVYGLIREMRKKIVAPVDTMGCDQAQFKESEPRVS